MHAINPIKNTPFINKAIKKKNANVINIKLIINGILINIRKVLKQKVTMLPNISYNVIPNV